jgi:site-specific DNA-adenine methylase
MVRPTVAWCSKIEFANKSLESQELRDYFSKKFDPEIQDFWFEVFWGPGRSLRFPQGRLYRPINMVDAMRYDVIKKTTRLRTDIDELKVGLSFYDKTSKTRNDPEKKNYEETLKVLEKLNNDYENIWKKLDVLNKELYNGQGSYGGKGSYGRKCSYGRRKRQSRKNKRKSYAKRNKTHRGCR